MKKVQRMFFIFLISLLVFCPVIQNLPIAEGSFSDVPSTHPAYDAIMYVQENKIVQGYEDGTYKPDITINRAEFTKIIIGAIFDAGVIDTCIENETEPTNEAVFFPDVQKTAWFAKYVCVAKTKNIIQGYPNGTFQPGNNINFAESAKIIANAFGYATTSDPVWYKPYVNALAEHFAIPDTIGAFDYFITRGEMAEMIYRLKAGITDKPTLTYAELESKSAAVPQDIQFNTNGDLISGWYWVRDSGLKQYASWSIPNITTTSPSLAIIMYALATNTYSGGRGYDANFRIYYGSSSTNLTGYIDVSLPNVSPADDPVGYSCRDTIYIPSSALNGGTTLFLKAMRSVAGNHVAFNAETVESVTGSNDTVSGNDLEANTNSTSQNTNFNSQTNGNFVYSDTDTDNDGMPDTVEVLNGTNPNDNDSDNDNVLDGEDLSPLINPAEPGFNDLQKVGMIRIKQPIQAWGLDGWVKKYHKNALCNLIFDAEYETTGTKKSTMDQTHYKAALNKVFEPDNFVAYKMENITPADIDVGDTEQWHDKDSEDNAFFEATCYVKPSQYEFYYDYITDYQLAYLKNKTERKYPSDTDYFRYILQQIKLTTYKEQFISFQFTDANMYAAMYDTDATHYKMPAFQYAFYSNENFNADTNVPYYEGIAMTNPESTSGRFSASLHIPKAKNTHSTAYLKITPMWITKNGYPVSYDPMVPSWDIIALTRSTVIAQDDLGNSKTITEEFGNFGTLNNIPLTASYFGDKRTSSDYQTKTEWMGIITKDSNNTTTPYTVIDTIHKIEKYASRAGTIVSTAVTYVENAAQELKKVDKIEKLPETHWARSPKYNAAIAGLGVATGIVSIATNGEEAWKAIKNGETADIIYYSTKTVIGGVQTASALAQIAQRTVGYAGKASRFAKLTTDGFAAGLAVAIGVAEVSYDIYKLANTSDPIAKAAYTEKIGADVIDTEISIGAVFAPQVLAFQVTWTLGAEIYSWFFGQDFAYSVAKSPGKALVFLAEYFFTDAIPSDLATLAYNSIRGDCPDENDITKCTGIIGQIRRLNDVQLPYLNLFIDPDV